MCCCWRLLPPKRVLTSRISKLIEALHSGVCSTKQAAGQTCFVVFMYRCYPCYPRYRPPPLYSPAPPTGCGDEGRGKKVAEGNRKSGEAMEGGGKEMCVCVCECDSMSVALCLSRAGVSLPEERSCWFNLSQARPRRPCPHLSVAPSVSPAHILNRTF